MWMCRPAKLVLTVFVALAAAATARPALACGGFFCSRAQPVVQLGERIVFISHGDGRTTAVVQIQYTGPSERFSWIIPVPGIPEVGVSSNILFNRLQRDTDPTWSLADTREGTCAPPPPFQGGADASAAGGMDAGGPPPVTVIDAGKVGPYDYEVIEVDPLLTDPADAAVLWLGNNGYDVGSTGPDLLRPYLEAGMNLLAFRLQKDRTAGDIRPATMTYNSELPMIPIKLTAVATGPNLGVATWIAGPTRAFPTNYRSVEINEARLDWLRSGSNYLSVVDDAVDEAGGHAMVAEFAAPIAMSDVSLWSPQDDAAVARIMEADYTGRESALIIDAMTAFNGWDGLSVVLESVVAPLVGRTLAEIQQCPSCVLPRGGEGALPGLDVAAFRAALEADVIAPLRDVAATIRARHFLTRFYTSLSAAEMTVDPVFDFSADLPWIYNRHVRTRTLHCRPDVMAGDASWTVELEPDLVVHGSGFVWPAELAQLPAAARVLQHTATGTGTVVLDNGASIRAAISAIVPPQVGAPDGGVVIVEPPPEGCSGCQTTGSAPGLALMFALGVVLRVARRRARG